MDQHDSGNAPRDEHDARTISRNARIGLILFAIYFVFYAGFVLMNAFYPQRMADAPFGGVNLAVIYGLFLIVAAFALALLYMFLVRRNAGDGR